MLDRLVDIVLDHLIGVVLDYLVNSMLGQLFDIILDYLKMRLYSKSLKMPSSLLPKSDLIPKQFCPALSILLRANLS